MLIAEEASARLASLRDPLWRARAEERVRKLRLRLREPARAFVAAASGHHVPASVQEYRQRQLAAARRLDQLAEGQRVLVMDALAPGLGAALARWWAEAAGWPYQRGWNRKAFRAPRAPELTVEARACELSALVELVGPFDADPVWLAGWGGHLAMGRAPVASTIGGVLACAIDLGGRCGEETLAALMAVGSGEHPVGLMGRHVVVGLLGSSRAEGWEFVERLLLAAQRQEGLRQVILEAADEGCPGAFDRILATVLEQKLLRFAAAVRAVGVWLGFGASVADIPQVEARVRALAAFRASSAERARALAGSDPWDVYVALCAQGMHDVQATIPEAQALAHHPAPGVRAAAIRYAAATGLMPGQHLVATALDDEDAGVASLAVVLLSHDGWKLPGAFDALTRLIPRLPVKARAPDDLSVGSAPVRVSRALAAGFLVNARGRRPVSALLPWLPSMDAVGRFWVAAQIAREPLLTAELRDGLIKLLSDRSSRVRQSAVRALGRTRLARSEAPAVEALLTRRATDTRRAALILLASLPQRAARASVGRLAASTNERQRAAATELARLIGAEPPAGQEVATARRIRADGGPREFSVDSPTAPGSAPLEDLRVTLVGEHARTQPLVPRLPHRGSSFGDDCARRIVQALDELVHEHRNTPVRMSSWQGSREVLLGDIQWGLASPFPAARIGPAAAAGGGEMVLGEVFREWWGARPAALRREDGLDELRAYVTAELATAAAPSPAVQQGADWWLTGMRKLVGGGAPKLRYMLAVRHVAAWLTFEQASAKVAEECLDAVEASLAMVPVSVLTAAPASNGADLDDFAGFLYQPSIPYWDWRRRFGSHPWHRVLAGLLGARPQVFTAEQARRWFRLMRWVEQPHPGAPPLPVDERLLVAAHEAGAASEDDVIASLLYPRSGLFRDLTRHGRSQSQARAPALTVIADKVRDRVIAVELQRGDLPTPTSRTALNIGSTSGAALAVRLLRLGDSPLARGRTSGHDSRDAVFSHLLRVSFPAPSDTAETLAAAAHQAGVPDGRLVDLAVYAPQWAPLVERALGWPGLTDGVLWLHAHTKDRNRTVDSELLDCWAAMAAERTPLAMGDLAAGAVDVAWFRASHAVLGGERWAALHRAAKYASNGSGHRRAQVFAEAMLGQLDEDTLVQRITAKRNQDAARALGLLPLPATGPDRQAAAQRRYGLLREFERGSRTFGSQRQAAEQTAVRMGIENLARTAGYADPGRFSWAMEAREAGNLADGPVTVTRGEVTLTLSVTNNGAPELTVRKRNRVLRSVPASLRKDAEFSRLRERKTALAQQAARVRAALEAAMTAQDTFTGSDFAQLSHHPVVAPMLGQLLWADDQGRSLIRTSEGAFTADGTPAPASEPLRLAHPADLLADGSWVCWQERLFTEERLQPFKQVFRELYVLTAAEREDSPISHRYDGHQLQPRQALALFGRRGWLTGRENGGASRVFHAHDLVARVEFVNGFLTPLEADLPTIEGVYFTRRGDHLAQPLESVPPVVFSEAMRDLDLVVSVAHAGRVDPEATASTTQMRAALIRETARLMKLTNISFAGNHLLIDGTLGEYSLHLGSGTMHRRPGGAICILPVGSQHRGRLFLPFADDDPKTAEIVSKALLLARDQQIQDPAILEQLKS